MMVWGGGFVFAGITFLVCDFVFSGGACTVAVIGTPGSVKCSNLRDQVSCHVERGVLGGSSEHVCAATLGSGNFNVEAFSVSNMKSVLCWSIAVVTLV